MNPIRQLVASLSGNETWLALPGYSPAKLAVIREDHFTIELSDGAQITFGVDDAEALHAILSNRGYLVAEDCARPRTEAQWILAAMSLTCDCEFSTEPVLFVLRRDAQISGRDINRIFRVGPLGGIRWFGPSSQPALVVILSRLDDERNPYSDRLDGNILEYTGQGLKGDQSLVRGNAALANSAQSDAPVYALAKVGQHYGLLGRAVVEDHRLVTDQGRDRVPRFVYKFRLRILTPASVVTAQPQPRVVDSADAVKVGRGTFRPKARLVHSLLGRDLVSNELVAILELVKNSYDADASRVTITIRPSEDEIEIRDDGHGMNLNTVVYSWLEPATSSKVRTTRSPLKRRRVLGNKGVGRFAASRLGNQLQLLTTGSAEVFDTDAGQEVRVLVDWAQFDDPDAYLDQVSFQWEMAPPADTSEHSGTTLLITHLSTDVSWTRDRVNDLRLWLSRMISPFSRVQDFDVVMDTPYRDMNGPVKALPLLERPHYTISGTVTADGRCSLRYHTSGVESISFSKSLDPERMNCGPFDFEFRVWNREEDDLRDVATLLETTVVKVRRELDKATGVNIYRDGFRVLPYGEPKNDWLRLDFRRVQNPTLRISNNQVVGAVFITGDFNPELRDQSNREGLIDNQAFDDLRHNILGLIMELEQRRYQARPRQPKKETGSVLEFSLADVKATIVGRYPDDAELIGALDTKSQELAKQAEAVTKTLVQYRRLATLGRLIDMILHDGRNPLGVLIGQTEIAEYQLSQVPSECFDPLIQESLQLIEQQGQWLSALFDKLQPLGGRERRHATNCVVEQVINDTVVLFQQTITTASIMVTKPSSCTTAFIDPAELQQVIVNFLDNSIYWLMSVDKISRAVSFRVSSEGDVVCITVADSGPGIAADDRDFIFDPYYTTKKDDGKGLGLFIAAEIVRENQGSLELIDSVELPGACFKVQLKAGQEM